MQKDNDLDRENHKNCKENVIEPINKIEKSIIYGLYSQLSSLENFYSRIQNHYKRLTVMWLVAAFMAMGFLFSQRIGSFPISIFYIVLFIFIAAMWGVTLLWFLDITIYQTYFFGVMVEKLKLEINNKWLPRVNENFLKMQISKKKQLTQSYFYIGCQLILLIFAMIICLNLIHFCWWHSILIIVGFVFLGIGISYLMYRIEKPKSNPVRQQFTKLVDQ